VIRVFLLLRWHLVQDLGRIEPFHFIFGVIWLKRLRAEHFHEKEFTSGETDQWLAWASSLIAMPATGSEVIPSPTLPAPALSCRIPWAVSCSTPPNHCSATPFSSLLPWDDDFCGEIKLNDGNGDLRKSWNPAATVEDLHAERVKWVHTEVGHLNIMDRNKLREKSTMRRRLVLSCPWVTAIQPGGRRSLWGGWRAGPAFNSVLDATALRSDQETGPELHRLCQFFV
jgi:hypothetical protein